MLIALRQHRCGMATRALKRVVGLLAILCLAYLLLRSRSSEFSTSFDESALSRSTPSEEQAFVRRALGVEPQSLAPSTTSSGRDVQTPASPRVHAEAGSSAPIARSTEDPPSAREIWSRESEDSEGTRRLEHEIQEALRGLHTAGSLREVSCRTTLCRVKLSFDSVDEARRFEAEAGTPERRKDLQFVPTARGEIDVDLLLAR